MGFLFFDKDEVVDPNALARDGSNVPSTDIDWNAKKITNLGAPGSDDDASTKKYVDDNVGAATPAGADTQIQFNESGSLGADAELTWDTGSSILNVAGTITISGVAVVDLSSSQALSNKTIDADSNSLSNIADAEIKTSAAIAVNKLAAITASRAAASDGSGFLTASATTSTELGFVSGLSSAVQTQLNAKAADAANSDITSMTGITGGIASPTFVTLTGNTGAVAAVPGNDDLKMEGLGESSGGSTMHIDLSTAPADDEALAFDSATGTWIPQAAGGGGTPGGADTELQFNDGGAFGAEAALTWVKGTNTLKIENTNPVRNQSFDGRTFITTVTTSANNPEIGMIGTVSSIEPLFYFDSNQSSENTQLGVIQGRWNGADVASIVFQSGNVNTGKNSGEIFFKTAPLGGGQTNRLRIFDSSTTDIRLIGSGATLSTNSDNTGSIGLTSTTRRFATAYLGTSVEIDSGDANSGNLKIAGTQLLEKQKTGWGAPTGSATRTTFATTTVTTEELAERLKALIDDLTSHGLIGS